MIGMRGRLEFLFFMTDAKRKEARLQTEGVKITRTIKKGDWGTIFRFADLDGNEFQVIED